MAIKNISKNNRSTPLAKIAVVGGGINGLFISWQLSLQGFEVELLEKGKILDQTSSASSKLLHGGIRYLEHGHIGLVRQSLKDRAWWLSNAPDYCYAIKICMPVFNDSPRSLSKLYAGATFYRLLAGRFSLGSNKWMNKSQTLKCFSDLYPDNLIGSISFFDAQMNEEKLGTWVAEQAENSGVTIHEYTEVSKITTNGEIFTSKFGTKHFDYIVNASGPWSTRLIENSNIKSKFELNLIRGSHLFLNQNISGSFLIQVPSDGRIIFAMPYNEITLLGTTEVPQTIDDEIKCSDQEREYLLTVFNKYFSTRINKDNIVSEISGLRPIVASRSNSNNHFSIASRESQIEVTNRILTVYGGKWTSAPSLSSKVVKTINRIHSQDF